MRICHFTSAHTPMDVRIYVKECCSLQEAGHEVWIVARGEDKIQNGIHFVGCKPPKGRISRMLTFSRKIYKAALKLNCDVYHFHDPELLPYGKKLQKKGKRVIFDSHEDVAGQILDKQWIPAPFRKMVSCLYKKYETRVVRRLDAVVAATPSIARIFEGVAQKTVVVNNYPKLDDIVFCNIPFAERERAIAYAGGLDELRGKSVIFGAMKDLDGALLLAGNHEQPDNAHIVCVGNVNREGVNKLYARARAGLVLYQPAANHYESQPIKMFEYMAAGLPFVASDFPLWQELVEGNQCGICVPPADVEKIKEAAQKLLDEPELSEQLGKNGRRAVEEKYNWEQEKIKLIALYREL